MIVSIPFKRERLSEHLTTSPTDVNALVVSFNSLQTGKAFRTKKYEHQYRDFRLYILRFNSLQTGKAFRTAFTPLGQYAAYL